MLWLIYNKYELPICSLVCYQPIRIIWTPTVDDGCRFVHLFENMSSTRIKLISLLFYRFILYRAKAFLPNPFQRGCPHPIGRIQRYHTVGGANGTTMVMMFVGWLCLGRQYFPYYSYCRKPTGREFFVPAWTLLGAILLSRREEKRYLLRFASPPR